MVKQLLYNVRTKEVKIKEVEFTPEKETVEPRIILKLEDLAKLIEYAKKARWI